MFSPLSNKGGGGGFQIDLFRNNPEALEIARQLSGGGASFERTELLEYLAKNVGKADVITNMLNVMDEATMGAEKGMYAFRAKETRRARETSSGRSPEEIERMMRVLDERLVGQSHIKEWVRRTLEALPEDPKEAAPFLVGLSGPPGVGKTELFRALAIAMYGDPDAVVIIRCGELKTKHSINTLLGADPGLVSSGDTAKISQLSLKEVEGKFGATGVRLVLFDEVDKIGDGDPEEIKSIMNALGSFMEDGTLRLKNGDVIDLRLSIIGFASNAGWNDPEGGAFKLGTDDARKHSMSAFKKMVPRHITSRVNDVLAFDPHTPDTVSQVMKKLIDDEIREQLNKAHREAGIDGRIVFEDPELLRMLGECGYHPMDGARPGKNIVRNLIEPSIRKVAKMMEDEEVWEFQLKDIKEEARKALVAKFRAADGGVPEGVNIETFPVRYECINPKPRFFDYEAAHKVPHDPKRPLIVLSSGAVGGQGFLVSKQSDAAPLSFSFLRAGVREAGDDFEAAPVELPAKLMRANNDLKVTNLDDRHLLFLGVGVSDKGVESSAFVYDSKTHKMEEVDPPEVPLVGAALVGGQGKALIYGGRVQEKRKNGWSVSADPREMNGQPIENQAYLFDLATKKWKWLEGAPEEGVVAAATVYAEGKGWIIGGEELFKPLHSPLFRSQASRNVWSFDFDKESFSKGPSLPKGTAFGTAFSNVNGNVQLLGGASYAHNGRDLLESKAMYRLTNGRWRTDEMRTPGLCLSAIPEHPGSWVCGPFLRPNGKYGFDILKPSED